MVEPSESAWFEHVVADVVRVRVVCLRLGLPTIRTTSPEVVAARAVAILL